MSARETRRRWLPGRQTLSRIDSERSDTAPQEAQGEEVAAAYDPVYDWFDLRDARTTEEDPAAH